MSSSAHFVRASLRKISHPPRVKSFAPLCIRIIASRYAGFCYILLSQNCRKTCFAPLRVSGCALTLRKILHPPRVKRQRSRLQQKLNVSVVARSSLRSLSFASWLCSAAKKTTIFQLSSEINRKREKEFMSFLLVSLFAVWFIEFIS